jgi:hypothetical protein
MEANTVFEQFRAAVGANLTHAADILIEHDEFWTTFEDDPPSWEECYGLVDSLYAKHREELAFTVVQHMFCLDDRLDDIDLDVDLEKEFSPKSKAEEAELESFYVSMVAEILKTGDCYVIRCSGSITSDEEETFEGDLEFQLNKTGMSLIKFELDQDDAHDLEIVGTV